MKITILADADSVAREAPRIIAAEARTAVAARGCFSVAFSGGSSPKHMLRALAGEDVPWEGVHVVQVDERVAPPGDPDRNLIQLRKSLLENTSLRPEQLYAMPVESSDLRSAATRYALTLKEIAGSPPVPDLAHLGLGSDGHAASLVSGDPALSVTEDDVALTGIYQGRERMTLTFSMLNRSRRILDVYDALTSPRIYRDQEISPRRALGIMAKGGGTDFDPILLKVFIKMIRIYPVGTLVKLDSGEIGLVTKSSQETDPLRPCVVLLESVGQNKFKRGNTVRLSETSVPAGSHKRNIVGSYHPCLYGIQPAQYLL